MFARHIRTRLSVTYKEQAEMEVGWFTQSANLYITADIRSPTCSPLHRTHSTNRAPLNAHKTNIVREVPYGP